MSSVLSSSIDRAERTLAAVTTHLWAGADNHALAVVENLISVNRATPNQQRVNGAGYEIEIDGALARAYSLPNLGASDGVFANDTERRWLGRLRKWAVKNDLQVVRKWQNRLIFHAREDRDLVRDAARVLAGWIVEDFKRRHVTEVEDTVITITQGECPYLRRWDAWYVYLGDGREVVPNRPNPNGDGYQSFLDALFTVTEIKRGTPLARYARRPLLWGTI